MKLLDSNTCHHDMLVNIACVVFTLEKFATIKDCTHFLRQHTLGVYALEFKGQMVGCIFLHLRDAGVWVRGLYVDPEYRMRGIGKWLLAIACQKAYYYGYDFVCVAPPDTRTADFFIKSGLFWEQDDETLRGFSLYRAPSLVVKF